MAESHDPVVKRRGSLGRALGVGSVILGLAFLGGAQVRATQILDKIDREAKLRQASSCVAAYERVRQLRDGDEFVIRTAADTLLQLASDDSDPATLARFRELVEGDVAEARANYDVTLECDLEESQRLLETEEG